MSHNQLHKKEQARKLEQDRLQIILNELLREEENKYCADCEAKGPRWASWNLGVFLCIRCAGIHRNLGVHVSKVKSINLDTWTPEQVQSVRVLGNSIAKAVYEANLPEHFRRPQTDSSLETFIRAKYEHKRYSAKDFELPKIDVRSLLHELDNFALRHNKKSATSNVPSSKCTTNFDPPKTCSENKDEKIKGSKSQNKPELAETNGSNAECDLLGLSIESSCSLNQPTDYSNSDNNDFGDFASAFSSVNDKPVSVSDSFALIDTELKGTSDKKTTIDILALYGPKSNQTISHSTNFAMPLVTDQSKSSTTSFNSDLASLIGGGVGQAPHQGFSKANNVFAPTIVGGANVSLTNLTNSNAATFPTPTMMYQRPVVSPFYSMNNPQSTVQSAEFAALNPFSNRPPAFKAGQQMPNQYAPLPQYFGPPASSVNQQPSIVLNSAHLSAGSLTTLGSLTNSNTGIVSSSLANQNLQAVQDQLAALKMKKNETATPPSKTATINGDLWH